jgi:hypothetical protein
LKLSALTQSPNVMDETGIDALNNKERVYRQLSKNLNPSGRELFKMMDAENLFNEKMTSVAISLKEKKSMVSGRAKGLNYSQDDSNSSVHNTSP